MRKLRYLDRSLTVSACCYALLFDEQSFHSELRQLQVPVAEWPAFCNAGAHATTHFLKGTDDHHPVALVCLPLPAADRDPITVAGLLVHEAVHIWQFHARLIGAGNDHGDEEEAYAIQNIAQQLMWAYKAVL